MHIKSKEHDSNSKETWKQLSKQPQNACQQNAVEHIYRCSHLFCLPLTITKFKHDKDFYDDYDCIRKNGIIFISAIQMCIILKRKYI